MTLRRLRRAATAVCVPLACLALLSSCAGDGSTLDPTGVPLGPPKIVVEPEELRLTLLEKTSQTVGVTVRNAGGLPLLVQRVISEQAFVVPSFAGAAELRGGQSVGVRVEVFAGEASPSPWEATVEIVSNDVEEPVATVKVYLEITPTPVPEIDVSPARFDLTLTEGESEIRALRISNLGSADLVVSDISSASSFLFPALATTIVAPADSATVPFTVSADDLIPGFHSGAIGITSNDEDEPFVMVPVELEVTHSGPFPATLSAIQANVFTPTCALSFCHGAAMSGNLVLSEGSSFANLVGRESSEVPGTLLVDPFEPDDSYLVCKIEGCPWAIGQQMPIIGDRLDDSEIEVIRRWISRGALDN